MMRNPKFSTISRITLLLMGGSQGTGEGKPEDETMDKPVIQSTEKCKKE
jgi:hypothetical protein